VTSFPAFLIGYKVRSTRWYANGAIWREARREESPSVVVGFYNWLNPSVSSYADLEACNHGGNRSRWSRDADEDEEVPRPEANPVESDATAGYANGLSHNQNAFLFLHLFHPWRIGRSTEGMILSGTILVAALS